MPCSFFLILPIGKIIYFDHVVMWFLTRCLFRKVESSCSWVLHATPSGGNGILGLLQLGHTVICLAKSESHATWLRATLKDKIMEEFCTKGAPVEDLELIARASALSETSGKGTDEKTPKKNKEDDIDTGADTTPVTKEKESDPKSTEKKSKDHKEKKDKQSDKKDKKRKNHSDGDGHKKKSK